MITALAQTTKPYRLILALAGLAWLARAVMALYGPDYWSPRTPLDYAAVVGTSLSLMLLAVGLWGFYHHNSTAPSRAQTVWRVGVWLTCTSAFIVGVSNFLEDAVGIKGLGYVWVIGVIAVFVGLLIAGVSALWVKGLGWWVGGLLLACAVGLLFIEWNGMFGLGLALLALSFAKGNSA